MIGDVLITILSIGFVSAFVFLGCRDYFKNSYESQQAFENEQRCVFKSIIRLFERECLGILDVFYDKFHSDGSSNDNSIYNNYRDEINTLQAFYVKNWQEEAKGVFQGFYLKNAPEHLVEEYIQEIKNITELFVYDIGDVIFTTKSTEDNSYQISITDIIDD